MKSLLGQHKTGKLFVISAPAGTGKTTLVHRLMKEFPTVVQSVSCTTRAPRQDEVDGVHYRFISKQTFTEMIEAGEFLEHVRLYGDYYGTSKSWVKERLEKGKHVLLVIDTQGAIQLKGKEPAVFIFIQPPSLEELKKRLLKRRTESEEVIAKRLAWAKEEIQAVHYYDYLIINDQIDDAYHVLKSILIAEEYKITGEINGY